MNGAGDDRADQLDLFATADTARPTRVGHADVEFRQARTILTKASGFMAEYDYTLNPYSGCTFGCTYCYAAFFVREPERQASWGRWVAVKENAVAQLRRMRTPLGGRSIYMSSVTDPYQPIERRLGLVRELLEHLAERQPRLVVQTRSPMVTRDIDLFRRFEHVRVNMTVTTDLEDVRRHFEPWCATTTKRLDAIADVARSGIPTSITLTPLLPVADAETFSRQLVQTGVSRFVVQPFHASRGRFVAGTRQEALSLLERHGWTDARYRATVDTLRHFLPHLAEGRSGFSPHE